MPTEAVSLTGIVMDAIPDLVQDIFSSGSPRQIVEMVIARVII